ncbi:MAG: glycosyltransferase family 2 protein [Bacteroidia bacterium]
MSGMPSISIIIPNYNYGNYIEETICSVINQNYPQLQLIIIDGGSTDNSVEIIKKYDKQINYWVSEKDNGQADAINKGLEVATGEYIAFINSDDVYLDDAFELIFTDKNSIDKDFIYGDVLIGKNIENAKPNKSKKNKLTLASLINFYSNAEYIIPSQSVFIKRDFLNKNNLNFLNTKLHYCMDLDWYCRISLHKPTVYKHKKIQSFFRINSQTKTVSQSLKMKNEALALAFSYLKYLNRTERNEFFVNRFIHVYLNMVYQKKISNRLSSLVLMITKSNFRVLKNYKFLGLLKNQILQK